MPVHERYADREMEGFVRKARKLAGKEGFLSNQDLFKIAENEGISAAIVSIPGHYMLYLGKGKVYDTLEGRIREVEENPLVECYGDIAKMIVDRVDGVKRMAYENALAAGFPVQVLRKEFDKLLPEYNYVEKAEGYEGKIKQKGSDCGILSLYLAKKLGVKGV